MWNRSLVVWALCVALLTVNLFHLFSSSHAIFSAWQHQWSLVSPPPPRRSRRPDVLAAKPASVGISLSPLDPAERAYAAADGQRQEEYKNWTRPKKDLVIYSKMRHDQSGSSFMDMISAHAYAYQKGIRYGGACGTDYYDRKKTVVPLIQAMGLEDDLAVECPIIGGTREKPEKTLQFDVSPRLAPKEEYFEYEMEELTKNGYLEVLGKAMKSKGIRYRPSPDGKKVISVHIRRGDVNPCLKLDHLTTRYSPNSYYHELIDRYVDILTNQTGNAPRVLIYSESNSTEPWDKFRSLGYEMKLDLPLEDTWRSMAFESDVMILSKSTFSNVPAILREALDEANKDNKEHNPVRVVYTKWAHGPMSRWDIVERETRHRADEEALQMFYECKKKIEAKQSRNSS